MSISLAEIIDRFVGSDWILEVINHDTVIDNFAAIENYSSSSLVFTDEEKMLTSLINNPPAAIVTNKELKNQLMGKCESAIIVCKLSLIHI